MGLFIYRPEQDNQPATLELDAADKEEAELLRFQLLHNAVKLYFEGSMSAEDVDLVYHSGIELFKGLPARIGIELIDTDEISTVNDQGLDLIIEESGETYLNGSDIIPMSPEDKDYNWVEELIRNRGYNYQAYQLQPNIYHRNGLYMCHDSLGYLGEDGAYKPEVTILHEEHPVRQLIESQEPIV